MSRIGKLWNMIIDQHLLCAEGIDQNLIWADGKVRPDACAAITRRLPRDKETLELLMKRNINKLNMCGQSKQLHRRSRVVCRARQWQSNCDVHLASFFTPSDYVYASQASEVTVLQIMSAIINYEN